MAVEARHMNLFPAQLLNHNSEIMNPMESSMNHLLPIGYGQFMMQGVDTAAMDPMNSFGISGAVPPVVMSRKRSRDDRNCYPSFFFLGKDVSPPIEQQNLDINSLIAQHMEKLKFEIEVRRRNQAQLILESIEERLMKRLKTKEDEMDKMMKMNHAMEEQIRSLFVENQIWRNVAQKNQVTANALRIDLDQVLTHVGENQVAKIAPDAVADNPLIDDAQSCCDSSGGGGSDTEEVIGGRKVEARDFRLCQECRKGHAHVLILPCRHLCLCTVCGTSVHTCPICKSTKSASVHVNLS